MKYPYLFVCAVFSIALFSGGCNVESQQTQSQTKQTAALKELHDSGVLSDQEYQQKLKALGIATPAGAATHAKNASASAPDSEHVWHMVRAVYPEMLPTSQSEKPVKVDALTVLIPKDWMWKAKNSTLPDMKADCSFTGGRYDYTVFDPAKTTGLTVIGGHTAVWSQSPQAVERLRAYYRTRPGQICEITPTKSLAENLPGVAPLLMKEGRAEGTLQPLPGVTEQMGTSVQQLNQQLQAMAQQSRVPASRIAVEAGRLRVQGMVDGRPSEAWIVAIQTVRYDPTPGGVVETTDVPLLAMMFAPAGQLDGQEKLLTAILDSTRIAPEVTEFQARNLAKINAMDAQSAQTIANMNRDTQNKLAQIHSSMAQDNLNTTATIAGIQHGTQQYESGVISNVNANRTAALSNSSQQFALSMNDQAVYHDPSTGHSVQLPNQYAHAWASTTGNTNEYILTDSASYNPNGSAGGAQWTQMQPQR